MLTASVEDDPTDPERVLALSYAAPSNRPALSALLELDDRLAAILRTTREPLVGQMRLTWWHQALCALDEADAPAEPVLQSLAAHVVPRIAGATLATMIEGWEALLDTEIDEATMAAHATARGEGLFAAMATVVGMPAGEAQTAGYGWALADLARNLSDRALAAKAHELAEVALATALARRWPPRARMIAALARSARMDLADDRRPRGHPARAARLLWLRMTGK